MTLQDLWKRYLTWVAVDRSWHPECVECGDEKRANWQCCDRHRGLYDEQKALEREAGELTLNSIAEARVFSIAGVPHSRVVDFPARIHRNGEPLKHIMVQSATWWAVLCLVLKVEIDLADPRGHRDVALAICKEMVNVRV